MGIGEGEFHWCPFVFMDIKIPRIAKSSYAAVYQMTIDDKWIYIGSSINIRKRLIHWICALKSGKHYKNKNIRQVVGSESKIRFNILEKVANKSTIRLRETHHLSCQKDNPLLLNRCPEGHTNAGIRPYFGQVLKEYKKSDYIVPKKPIAQFYANGTFIQIFPSITSAATELKIKTSAIHKILNGKQGLHKGTTFKLVNPDGSYQEPLKFIPKPNLGGCRLVEISKGKFGSLNHKSRAIAAYTQDGALLKKFEAVLEAERILGIKSQNIHAVLSGKRKTVKGLTFKYCS